MLDQEQFELSAIEVGGRPYFQHPFIFATNVVVERERERERERRTLLCRNKTLTFVS